MTQRLGWGLPGLGGQQWLGQHWATEARQMSHVLTTFSPVTCAWIHGDKWLEFMCFAQLAKSILLLRASTGDPVALGLEKDPQENQDAAFSVIGLCSLLS